MNLYIRNLKKKQKNKKTKNGPHNAKQGCHDCGFVQMSYNIL